MSSQFIILPSKPKIIKDEDLHGIFEVDGLYPGYGHTLGNSLRRVILSSIPGTAITSVAIEGVLHEFSTLEGVSEDVINIILNLKKVKFKVHGDEPITVTLKVKGPKQVTANDLNAPTQIEIINKDQYLFGIDSNKEVNLEFVVEKGLGYVPRESMAKTKADAGRILLDSAFTPVRRVSYEVENMRVGDRTDHNRLRMNIETDGSISPKQAFEDSINTMIQQLQSIVGYREFSIIEEEVSAQAESNEGSVNNTLDVAEDNLALDDITKTKIEDLNLSTRTLNTLLAASIRTVSGIIRKTKEDLNDIEGMGDKGLEEIDAAIKSMGLSLKESE